MGEEKPHTHTTTHNGLDTNINNVCVNNYYPSDSPSLDDRTVIDDAWLVNCVDADHLSA